MDAWLVWRLVGCVDSLYETDFSTERHGDQLLAICEYHGAKVGRKLLTGAQL